MVASIYFKNNIRQQVGVEFPTLPLNEIKILQAPRGMKNAGYYR